MKRKIVWLGALCLCASTLFGSERVRAFCGFYVAGGNAELFADASMVVMMRDGTTTVLSMQNDYRGPPENFALIVPVPEVLDESRVHTLPREVFDRVDQLASPRLVEYWEQDPCYVEEPEEDYDREAIYETGAAPPMPELEGDLGVTIEAEFAVGEYQIVILSAADSSGLETWLRQENYNIPDGAEARLRPYVEAGSKFFVAKVDVSKVTFGEEGVAQLSPLRVHYTSEAFELPIRLGLVNAAGAQDLIVHVLARNQRFELANRPNVTIPTNIDVNDSVRDRFGPFYVALFDETVRRNPGAVVTEYAWQATNCDPCPGPVLTVEDLTFWCQQVISNEIEVTRDQLMRNDVDLICGTASFEDPHTISYRHGNHSGSVRADYILIGVGTNPAHPPPQAGDRVRDAARQRRARGDRRVRPLRADRCAHSHRAAHSLHRARHQHCPGRLRQTLRRQDLLWRRGTARYFTRGGNP